MGHVKRTEETQPVIQGQGLRSFGPTAATDGISPALLSLTWIDLDNSETITGGDTLDFEFSETIHESTITESSIDSVLPTARTGTTYGTTPTLSWSMNSTILRVLLGTGVDVVTGDTINPTDSVTDVEGNADATAGIGPAIS